MPGSGKSTLGRRLAEYKGLAFVDTDDLIEQAHGCSLQSILDRHGYLQLRAVEQEVLCTLQLENHVIATGGSVVYSDKAMRHLASLGAVVYLHISINTLVGRVNNTAARGLAKLPSQTLRGLYRERLPLYRQWADTTIDNNWPLSAWRFTQLEKQISE